MATKRKLQIRYGAAADRPTLATGELGLDTDTGSEALYVGTPAGNKVVASMGVKKYVALLTQSGTSAPIATVLENTLGGTVVWAYSSVGSYTATLAGAFTQNKTALFISNGIDPIGGGNFVGIERSSADVIDVTSGVITTGDTANDIIVGTTIMITVYP